MVYLFHIHLTLFTIEFTEHVKRGSVDGFSTNLNLAAARGAASYGDTFCMKSCVGPNQNKLKYLTFMKLSALR
jgi:hypothetical protein